MNRIYYHPRYNRRRSDQSPGLGLAALIAAAVIVYGAIYLLIGG